MLYSHVFVSLSPVTENNQQVHIQKLLNESFFHLVNNKPGTQCGDHFLAGYRLAVLHSDSETMLHSCDLDKVAHALLGKHRHTYLNDLAWANQQQQPVLFQRSPAAWQTFPDHYRIIEHYAIDTGKLLFNKYYDFACSHFAMPAQIMQQTLPDIKGHDFRILLEIILLVRNQLLTRDVDWLEWEDPFVLNVDADTLLAQRDHDPLEVQNRMSYIIPFLQILYDFIPNLEK